MLNLFSCNESRLTLTDFIPASLNTSINRSTRIALVVIANSTGSLPNSLIMLAASFFTRGSPPVKRIFFTPIPTKTLAIAKVSSLDINSDFSRSGIPSSGMQ